MTPLPALSDVIRETLTEEVLDGVCERVEAIDYLRARNEVLNALLLPLTEREQGLREELAELLAELQTIDSLMARRPALDERTRYDNIAKAIRVAGQADAALRRAEAAEARVSALTAELEALKAKFQIAADIMQSFTDVFAGESTTDGDLVRRLTRKLEAKIRPLAEALIAPAPKRLAGAPHAPTQEKA